MWQAISTLLRDWHTEDAEIELKTELPGGEIHSAWHLRFGGKDYFVKCDERELLPIFTAESDQLELLSRSKTVRVPQVLPSAAIATIASWSWSTSSPSAGCAQCVSAWPAASPPPSVERSAAVRSGF